MLLGGSPQQIPAIKYAKSKGFYTIVCDYLNDNPGQKFADKFYLESTTNMNQILEIAKKEKIDGIVAYASDPAASTAAYVSEQLGLNTNPYKSVEILSSKNKFRNFLKRNDFSVPKTLASKEFEEIEKGISAFNLPILMKPTDSSGSKGITKLYMLDNLEESFYLAKEFSREGMVIIEEFIEMDHDYLIGGDFFVLDGKLEFLGLLNCHRDNYVNPLVPVGKSFPAKIDSDRVKIIETELKKIIKILGLNFGGFNVEMMFNKDNELFFIEIGPRSGGNMIPELLKLVSEINMMELTIDKAMGEPVIKPKAKFNKYYATHNLHTKENGTLKSIEFDSELEKYIIKKEIYVEDNDQVSFFDSANKALGIIFMKFTSMEEMYSTLDRINNLIKIEVR